MRGHKNGVPLISISGLEKCIQPEQLEEIFKEKVENKKESKEKKPDKMDKVSPDISKVYYAPRFPFFFNFIILFIYFLFHFLFLRYRNEKTFEFYSFRNRSSTCPLCYCNK